MAWTARGRAALAWMNARLPTARDLRGVGIEGVGERMSDITQDFQRQPQALGFMMRGLEEQVEALLLLGAPPGDIFEVLANSLQAQADKSKVFISQLLPGIHPDLRRDALVAEFGDIQTFTRAAMAAEGITQAEVDAASDLKLTELMRARNGGHISENYKYGTPYRRRKTQ